MSLFKTKEDIAIDDRLKRLKKKVEVAAPIPKGAEV